jgi:hypothetical protein
MRLGPKLRRLLIIILLNQVFLIRSIAHIRKSIYIKIINSCTFFNTRTYKSMCGSELNRRDDKTRMHAQEI